MMLVTEDGAFVAEIVDLMTVKFKTGRVEESALPKAMLCRYVLRLNLLGSLAACRSRSSRAAGTVLEKMQTEDTSVAGKTIKAKNFSKQPMDKYQAETRSRVKDAQGTGRGFRHQS